MIVPDQEYLDFSRVPESRGVPRPLTIGVIVGLLMIFAIGGASCLLSGYGHVWPSSHSMRVDLGTLHE